MVIAFCTLYIYIYIYIYIYSVICNVGIVISKLLFVECFNLFFHLLSFTHHNVAKNICRTSKLQFKVSKVESCVLKLWFHFLIKKFFISTQFASNFFSIELKLKLL
jgi:hypothetical protein